MLQQEQQAFTVSTRGREFHEITDQVGGVVGKAEIRTGVVTVHLHHTSASLLISENADRDVQRDLEAFMTRLVPDGDVIYRHVAEGPDDMPSHVRSVLTQTSLTLPVCDGRCDLGTWQGVYLWEHRHRPHRRRLTVSVVGT